MSRRIHCVADRLIGAVSLPALHGGSVASLLATAAGDLAQSATDACLVAITIQYLRAARAENVDAEAEWEKRGARSSVVAAVARQAQGSREVARATRFPLHPTPKGDRLTADEALPVVKHVRSVARRLCRIRESEK